MADILDRLHTIETRYDEVSVSISDPAVMSDQDRYRELLKEHAALQPIVDAIVAYRTMREEQDENRQLAEQTDDRELREMAREEANALSDRLTQAEAELIDMLTPRDPRDERSVIVEIRAGAGGDEAALFASDLYRMYTLYAERTGWKTEIMDVSESELGGMREVVFDVQGVRVFSRLKFESGVHRVQRVPVTESGGRIHTSTVTVAVLAEADPVDVAIDPNDLDIDTYRASGAGGQHVNRTDSAIRITHRPSGIVVTCQDQRSQHKNRERAMTVLRARLFDAEQQRHADAVAGERRSQVGTGDRSERIRTYNYPQNRMTDHRIGLTLYRLDAILNGDLDAVLDALVTADRADGLGRPDRKGETA